VASLVLRQPIDALHDRLGVTPGTVVVTAPAWLGPQGRAALVASARRARLPPPLVMTDVVARAVHLAASANTETRAAIVDVGAGGVSAAIVSIGWWRVEVLGVAGDGAFGGADVDAALRRSILLRLPSSIAEIAARPDYTLALRSLAESVKRDLAHADPVPVPVPFLRDPSGDPVAVSLHRVALAAPLRELGERIRAVVAEALRAASLPASAVRQLHAAGGMVRVPEVLAAIEASCGRRALLRLGPDSAACGAALRAALVDGEVDLLLTEGSAPPRASSSPPARVATDVRVRCSTLPRGLLETAANEARRPTTTPPPPAHRTTESGFPAASAPSADTPAPSTRSPQRSTLPPTRARATNAVAPRSTPSAGAGSTRPPQRPMQAVSERRPRAEAATTGHDLVDLTDDEIDAAFAMILTRSADRASGAP
jgi:hypothetical protein